jgi:hypothetical protein
LKLSEPLKRSGEYRRNNGAAAVDLAPGKSGKKEGPETSLEQNPPFQAKEFSARLPGVVSHEWLVDYRPHKRYPAA